MNITSGKSGHSITIAAYGRLLIVMVFIAGISCDRSRFFDQTVDIPAQGWHMDSTARLEVEIDDTIQSFSFFINVRNNDNYPYRNLYLFLNSWLPEGERARDTIELVLADRSGKWHGKGFGQLKDNQIKVRSNLRFPTKGKYLFEIEHAMRDTVLTGIENIGIRIEHPDE
ncbi:MAG: gliding motility lipoprotein GldH [Sphingobacteriia bacterium]|nr:gliding motility lipoprotein GldH [Sphingobacteriia bacterium]